MARFRLRCAVGRRGTGCGGSHHPFGRTDRAGAFLYAGFCGRRHDLCGGGGADPGGAGRRPQQSRDSRRGHWVCDYDGSGCCTRLVCEVILRRIGNEGK